VSIRRLLVWGSASLLGHIVVIGPVVFVAFVALGLYGNYSSGTLTWDWVPYIIMYSLLGGVLFGMIVWYGGTRVIRKRKRGS
jgi:NhaP-type Na+/H+ or K+/H+ antiporter